MTEHVFATAAPAAIAAPTDDAGAPPAPALDPAETGDAPEDLAGAGAFAAAPAPLREALFARGFVAATAVQAAVLLPEARDRDLAISSQTGSGKTVALGLAVAHELLASEPAGSGPRVLVLAPTRELAMQLALELGWLFARADGVRVDRVTGGTDKRGERARLERRPACLVGTPGRLVDHLEDRTLDLSGVRAVVLDEADQMLDMGFREDLEKLLDAMPAERRTHLVSATFPPGIQRLAARYQRDPLSVEGTRRGVANADIEHVAHVVDRRSRYAALVNVLLMREGERALVFANTRADCAQIAEQLTADGIPALLLSGELSQPERTRTLAAFRDGLASVVVATDVAARGLDVPDVGVVVHATPALDPESYTHRSGRTGRAGRTGTSVVLAPAKNERGMRRVLREAGVEAIWRPAPSADDVRAALSVRARERVLAALAASEDRGACEHRRALARELCAAHPAERVVEVLLESSRLSSAARPRDVEAIEPRFGRERRQPGVERRERAPEAFDELIARPPRRSGSTERVRYSINWGTRTGATPKRVLAHVCRRGGIQSRVVGAIRLDAHACTFEIGAQAAQEFESRVRRRDPRDPNLWIRRVEAAAG